MNEIKVESSNIFFNQVIFYKGFLAHDERLQFFNSLVFKPQAIENEG